MLGKTPLAKLRPTHVQQFMTEKLNAGVSPHSVRYCRVVLRAALGQAVTLGLVVRNTAALTSPPKIARPRSGTTSGTSSSPPPTEGHSTNRS
ncbi:MAG: hypothetical protein KGJ86_04720 [Chloroflexota bacterium]|nr:hypothetical protein [Chloroflexota bacterium]